MFRLFFVKLKVYSRIEEKCKQVKSYHVDAAYSDVQFVCGVLGVVVRINIVMYSQSIIFCTDH